MGVTVEVATNMFGTLHVTDIHDDWRRQPLEGLTVGGHIRVKVVEVSRNKDKWCAPVPPRRRSPSGLSRRVCAPRTGKCSSPRAPLWSPARRCPKTLAVRCRLWRTWPS
jgi:hypothetical protein